MNDVSPQDVARAISTQTQSLKLFTSSGYGDFETPEGEYSAHFDMSIRKPSTTSIRLYGPFGIKVAQARLSSDTLLVYNSLNNEVFVGKPTESNLRHFLVIAADGASLSDILLGMMAPLSHLDSSRVSSKIDGGFVTYTYTSADTIEKFTVDGEFMRITGFERSIAGETIIRITYSDFTSVDKIFFPKSVFFEDLKRNISAKLVYQEIALNEKTEIQITVPPDAREIDIN